MGSESTDQNHRPSTRDLKPSSSGPRSKGSKVCAACSHQRRKCGPNCPLAPYFPACKRRDFINAHKLFGIKNLTKALASIDEEYRDDFMVSVIYEANARAADPVGGCRNTIRTLYSQLQCSIAELEAVNQELAFYRSRYQDMKLATAAAFDQQAQPGQGFCRLNSGRVSSHTQNLSSQETQSSVGGQSFSLTPIDQ
ncbi:unnamed protein product [Cuscuta epithymum]|uniref:LOB domain-containing protein n=1 Tax=Cuscuta epithymum TaxID=186058 RepID=A0AAV0C8L6_9ASTE|nr:unnamed protein product [Cuscuta epithymum]